MQSVIGAESPNIVEEFSQSAQENTDVIGVNDDDYDHNENSQTKKKYVRIVSQSARENALAKKRGNGHVIDLDNDCENGPPQKKHVRNRIIDSSDDENGNEHEGLAKNLNNVSDL